MSRSVTVSDDALGLTSLLDLDDLKWDFRALGCECSEPELWGRDPDDERDEWVLRIRTEAALIIELFDCRHVFIESECDLIFPDSVEWQVLALLMKIVGAPGDIA